MRADAAELDRNTAYRLLRTLESAAYVVQSRIRARLGQSSLEFY